jgi:hypothetical protein
MTDEKHDFVTGEVFEGEVVPQAADGGLVPYAATTAGNFIDLIEDGQFSADARQELGGMVARMKELAEATGNKQKGRLVITVDMTTEGEAFTVVGSYKLTPPKETRRKTIMWADEKNRMMRSQPRHGVLFGVRQVSGPGAPVRTV